MSHAITKTGLFVSKKPVLIRFPLKCYASNTRS
nr:MAG TPA: hypothetical protein [Caudoviricetes sp.]